MHNVDLVQFLQALVSIAAPLTSRLSPAVPTLNAPSLLLEASHPDTTLLPRARLALTV